ncbi:MAG: hypothetical protein R2822_23590 [Spirosomataceae bacterium]
MKEPLTIHIELALLSDAVALRQLSEQTFLIPTPNSTPKKICNCIDTYFDLNKIQQELVNKQLVCISQTGH